MKENKETTGATLKGLDHLPQRPSPESGPIDTDSDTEYLPETGLSVADDLRNHHRFDAGPDEHLTTQRTCEGVPASAGASTASKSYPPLLIGGLLQQNPNRKLDINLTGIGIDYLTVTVPETTAEVLRSKTAEDEPGTAGRGFRNSEKRMCMGGYCWRRWDPITSSKMWGSEYETWEFAGVTAFDPSQYLLNHASKPSRIDIAFDYRVPADYYPIELEPLIEDHVEKRGAKINYMGERKKQTLYVGSRKSDRQIRIYRRDEKNPLLAAEGHHILRVELTLRRDHAEALWQKMRQGGTQGHAEAAAHILEMTGYSPCDDVSSVPSLIRSDEDTEAVQMVLQFVTQNAVMLKACSVCGVDLANMADAKISVTRHRMNDSRLAQKVQVLGLIEPDRLRDQVLALMGR